MAKRAKKPPKKREQPWLAAARQRLRAAGDARHEEEMSSAFLDLAAPLMNSLGPDAGYVALGEALHLVQIAWNLPLVHAVPTEPGSSGAEARAEIEDWFALPRADREALAPLAKVRVQLYRHCGVLLADVIARRVGSHNQIALRFDGEEIPASSVLDIDESGWPLASHSLLNLSRPARDLLTVPYDDTDAQRAIDLATTAWNLPVLDRAGPAASESLRQRTVEAAARARDLPPAWREAFEAMLKARATRFSYDRRLIAAAQADTQDGMIRVETAALSLEPEP